MLSGRILLVDDNQVNQMVASAMLEQWNLKYKCANDGKEAVAKWQRLKPDLILMDIQMPICDGYKASKRIRTLENQQSRIPIIAMTANDCNDDFKAKYLLAGMDDYLAKPFDQNELFKKLSQWLPALNSYHEA
jgi:CheY-like chemotaxis protein